jgi:hypothetical protein
MKLKIRKMVENVNFNKKGDEIENDFFGDKKEAEKEKIAISAEVEKKEETTSSNNVAKPKINSLIEVSKTLPIVAIENSQKEEILTPPDENLQKGIAVSNRPDSSIVINNGSPLKDNENNRKGEILAKTIPFLGAVLVVLILAGGYFGLEAKDIYLTKVPLAEVMKGNAQAVLNVNSNTEFEQYKYLDDNLRKFPGYKLLEKKLDSTGEGKTISQAFQDELAEKNLSFNDDIKPVIGDNTLVVIPALTPLTNKFQKFVFDYGKKSKNALRKMELEGKVADAGKSLTEGDLAGAGKIKVLGMTSDFYTNTVALEEMKSEPVDFIIGAEIKSLKEAKRVLEKLRADKSKYEISEMKFEGYSYYKLTQKGDGTQNDADQLVNIKDTYHALVGHNWIMATKEADLKEMLSARKANHFFSRMTFWKKQKETMVSLADDKNYDIIKENLVDRGEEGFASFYLKTNLNNLVPSENPESQQKKFFKNQEGDLLVGILLRATPEGFVLRSTSNQINLSGVENGAIGSGLIQKMSKMVDGRWTDFYVETENLKNIYYSFKKNNLTDEGVEMLNEFRNKIKQESGLDFEADLLDHFSGNEALALFTAKSLSPQGAVVIEIDDKEAMMETAKKIVTMIKQIESDWHKKVFLINQGYDEVQKNIGNSKEGMANEEEIAEKIRLIQETPIVEMETVAGTVYSYKLPFLEEAFFSFAFADGKMILGSGSGVVAGLLEGFRTDEGMKLAGTPDFDNLTKNLYPEGYSKIFITPIGVWNGVNYYMDKMGGGFGVTQSMGTSDSGAAIGAIIKTINSISAIETASSVSEDEAMRKSSIFIEIKEINAEEKEYAEQILGKY